MTDYQISFLTGYKILEKEFNWISRKTTRGWLFLKYEYYAHTPYVKAGPFDTVEEALFYKLGFDR